MGIQQREKEWAKEVLSYRDTLVNLKRTTMMTLSVEKGIQFHLGLARLQLKRPKKKPRVKLKLRLKIKPKAWVKLNPLGGLLMKQSRKVPKKTNPRLPSWNQPKLL